MKKIKLNTDFNMPAVGLGTWKSKPGEVYMAVRWAIKLGYRHIDCASIYGNEVEVGQALFDAMKEDEIKREELFVTSKLWNNAHKADDVIPALQKTLKDLRLEYLDLYLIHWPVAQKKECMLPSSADDMLSLNDVPLNETWVEMEKAVEQGLVRSIGVSNFGVNNLKRLMENAKIIPAVNQVENHPFLPQNDLVEFCKKNNIAVTAYSPLGSRDSQNSMAPNLLENNVIKEMASKLKCTPAQVLLAWQLQRGLIVIPKTVHEDRLRENFASQVIDLDAEDMEIISRLENGHRFIDGSAFAYGDYTPETIFA